MIQNHHRRARPRQLNNLGSAAPVTVLVGRFLRDGAFRRPAPSGRCGPQASHGAAQPRRGRWSALFQACPPAFLGLAERAEELRPAGLIDSGPTISNGSYDASVSVASTGAMMNHGFRNRDRVFDQVLKGGNKHVGIANNDRLVFSINRKFRPHVHFAFGRGRGIANGREDHLFHRCAIQRRRRRAPASAGG